jgi:mannose/fructose/N-acetylgalactosamine-specific phosphotransferase system component IIC
VAHDTGAGFAAGLLVGQVQWLQGHSEEAEVTLSLLVGSVTGDAERTMLATAQIDNLVLGLNRSAEAVSPPPPSGGREAWPPAAKGR